MKHLKWADSDGSRPLADFRIIEHPPDESNVKAGNGTWSQWHQFLDKELFEVFAECKRWRQDTAKKRKVDDEQERCRSQIRSQSRSRDEIQLVNPVVNWRDATGFPGGRRMLPPSIAELPFFYFEHAQKQDWRAVSRLFFDLDPEPVDARHCSGCLRCRGYIHNLPVQGRIPALHPPAMNIRELFTDPSWPAWDKRLKIRSPYPLPSRSEVERVATLAKAGAEKGEETRERIVDDMRRLGMVWAEGKARQMSVTELEVLLGYKPGHTSGSGTMAGGCAGRHTDAERFKWLHTAPSVHVLALHFSVLKPLFPGGLAVLSLCSGIGGLAVALHRLGAPVRLLISLDTDPKARAILEAWWYRSRQRGNLVQEVHDVRGLTRSKLAEFISRFGHFDLVACGTRCKSLVTPGLVPGPEDQAVGPVPPLLYEMNRVLRDVRELRR